jgi:hypothetical protein
VLNTVAEKLRSEYTEFVKHAAQELATLGDEMAKY